MGALNTIEVTNIRHQVISNIISIVKEILGEKHLLTAQYDVKCTHICPYCISFKYWCDITFGIYSGSKYRNDIFDVGSLKLKRPIISTHFFYYCNESKTYEMYKIPIDIILNIYKKDLEMTYLILYQYLCDFICSLNRHRNKYWLFKFESEKNYSDNLFSEYGLQKISQSVGRYIFIDNGILSTTNLGPRRDLEYGCSSTTKEALHFAMADKYLAEFQKEYQSHFNDENYGASSEIPLESSKELIQFLAQGTSYY